MFRIFDRARTQTQNHQANRILSRSGTNPVEDYLTSLRQNLPSMTEVVIENENVGSAGAILLSTALLGNTCVKVLVLSVTNIDDEPLAGLINSFNDDLPLEHLDISANKVGKNTALAIKNLLVKSATLKVLTLQHTYINHTEVKTISEGIRINSSLETLNFDFCSMFKRRELALLLESISNSSALIHKVQLKNISDCKEKQLLLKLADDNFKSFTTLNQIISKLTPNQTCVDFSNLHLNNNQLANSLHRVSGYRKVERVNLSNNDLSANQLQGTLNVLSSFPALIEVNLSGIKLGNRGAKQLYKFNSTRRPPIIFNLTGCNISSVSNERINRSQSLESYLTPLDYNINSQPPAKHRRMALVLEPKHVLAVLSHYSDSSVSDDSSSQDPSHSIYPSPSIVEGINTIHQLPTPSAPPLDSDSDNESIGSAGSSSPVNFLESSSNVSCESTSDDLPDEFFCCITLDVFSFPVILRGDGFTYEEEDLKRCLAIKNASPHNNTRFNSADDCTYVINRNLLMAIDTWSSNKEKGMLCTLTNKLMEDPVVLFGDGYSYERSAITLYLENNNISPATQSIVSENGKTLVTNYNLKQLIIDHRSASNIAHTTDESLPVEDKHTHEIEMLHNFYSEEISNIMAQQLKFQEASQLQIATLNTEIVKLSDEAAKKETINQQLSGRLETTKKLLLTLRESLQVMNTLLFEHVEIGLSSDSPVSSGSVSPG